MLIRSQAEIYEHEGNDQQTYLLTFRHASLVIGNLTNHPEVKQHRHALVQANKDVQNDLQKLEVLKPRIKKRYERYQQLMRERDARRGSVNSVSTQSSRSKEQKASPAKTHKRLSSDPAANAGIETLAAGDNRDLAVQLAHKEIKRRATARKATRQAGISEELEQERRTAGVWGNWEEAFTSNDRGIDQDTLSRQMQDVRSQVNGSNTEGDRLGKTLSSRPSFESQRSQRSTTYRYPAVPDHSTYDSWSLSPPAPTSFLDDSSGQSTPRSPLPPELPPKDYDFPTPRQSVAPPPRPQKEAISPTNDAFSNVASIPAQSDLNPSTFTFQPSAYLENGNPLRTVFLPPDLRHKFLSMAEPNTRANLETCGILCGTLISNALFISKLVVPDQESTSDTCETINESELFDYVDGEDLMVLGWIHTHPTQTCFMSSRDLHTHGGYQVMIPESIAIVCAPSKGEWGVFRLSDPPGMKTVLNCTQTGLFHPHAESNIYTDALHPGHVVEAKGLEFDVVDLRPR